MRHSKLALVAVTLGLLTLACSGGSSSLVGPGAVTDSGQTALSAPVMGPLAQTDPTPTEGDTDPNRPIDSGRYEPDISE